MPRGVYERNTAKGYQCRKCTKHFNDLSSMRKHQWTAHSASYDGMRRASKELLPKAAVMDSVRQFLTEPTYVPQSVNGHAGDMTVAQLLGHLRTQRVFLDDVMMLIAGIASREEGKAHE